MSAPAGEEPEEPDLTALLDLVLQLVMFFLAVARIDNEMRDQSVVLPQASIARSLTKDYNKIVIVNLFPAPPEEGQPAPDPNARVGKVKYSVFEGYGVREYGSEIEVKNALKGKIEADQKATSKADWDAGKGRSLIVLRAHKSCNFKQVFRVMNAAREVGYLDIQLRAYVAGVQPR
ncbi:MAG: biopolymer transporter ExbD [Fimbriiglobus sp.]|jgi:biopolymer transport protein ExbD|nr:biopolymer transporter ExbD [Fimbriiglobus sp.]